jgi:hypothetical protein
MFSHWWVIVASDDLADDLPMICCIECPHALIDVRKQDVGIPWKCSSIGKIEKI